MSTRVAGYVDPCIVADSVRTARLLELIRQRGMTLHKVHEHGEVVRLTGPAGQHVLAASLSRLTDSDLIG